MCVLRIDRKDREPRPQGPLDARVDMAKLGIPVGMVRPLLGLARALQTVVLVVEELGHLHVTDRMTLAAQLRRQGPRALADPAQRGFRIDRQGTRQNSGHGRLPYAAVSPKQHTARAFTPI